MNTKSTEKRVVNINKEDFDTIKEYCDANAFNMPKWLTRTALEKIEHHHIPKNYYSLLNDENYKSIEMCGLHISVGVDKESVFFDKSELNKLKNTHQTIKNIIDSLKKEKKLNESVNCYYIHNITDVIEYKIKELKREL